MLRRLLIGLVGALIVLAVTGFAAFQLSPWPAAVVIRYFFDRGGDAAAAALQKHVPDGIAEKLDVSYGPDAANRLDVFYPSEIEGTDKALPVIMWVHGGAWISGSKEHVANYLRILASKGFVAVGIDYSIAPAAKYPTPVIQANEALAFLNAKAGEFHIDPTRIFLAGDSAGAQIAAQLANVVTSRGYAQGMNIVPAIGAAPLRGIVLNCGGYDPRLANFDGAAGGFLRTVFWSYLGNRDFDGDPRIQQFSIMENMTAAFPPAFITVGNADPLEEQSHRLAEAAQKLGIKTDTLFFTRDYQPPLPHEYQFNLDIDAGRTALERTVAFLQARS